MTDHVNNYRRNPLLDSLIDAPASVRHLDSSEIYSKRLVDLAFEVAKTTGSRLSRGIYTSNIGPAYETNSEVQSGIEMGIGSFGMSTVPETLVAHFLGLEVFGMSLCTNLAAGLSDEVLSHSAVRSLSFSLLQLCSLVLYII